MGSRVNAEIYEAEYRTATILCFGYTCDDIRAMQTWSNTQLAEVLEYLSEYLGCDEDMDVRIHTRLLVEDEQPYRVLRIVVHSHLFDHDLIE